MPDTSRAVAPAQVSVHEPAPRQSTLHWPEHAITQRAPPLQLTFELAPTRTLQLVLLQMTLLLAEPSCVHCPPGPQVTLQDAAQVVLQVAPEPHTKLPLALEVHAQDAPLAQAQSLAPPAPHGHDGPGHVEAGAPQPTEAEDSARLAATMSTRMMDGMDKTPSVFRVPHTALARVF
ncbi:MAG: hypothetical protein Q8Q09_21865 [Deltaproteobacteria bacterium]|nr:hypothetical protein [Deltaproteobacteria bacterium]